ncbi:MAG: methyltransferase domain-containing protein [Burkholderiaceae bacterium]
MIRSAVQGMVRSTLQTGRRALGLPAPRRTEDRRVLEQVILPAYAGRRAAQRLLFVGCAAYTKSYGELFTAHEYWTIDPVPRRRRHGGARHIVDCLQNLGPYAPAEYFDVIVCNGVLGWGLDELADADAAFAACYRHLRAGGELLVGWNDVMPRNRVRPDSVPSLSGFQARIFAPLQTATLAVRAANRHVFSFYAKPLSS